MCLWNAFLFPFIRYFEVLDGKTGKYLLYFHLVFALWATQLCVYMQFVQEEAISASLIPKLHRNSSSLFLHIFYVCICVTEFSVNMYKIFAVGWKWCKCACVCLINRMEMQLVPQEMFRALTLCVLLFYYSNDRSTCKIGNFHKTTEYTINFCNKANIFCFAAAVVVVSLKCMHVWKENFRSFSIGLIQIECGSISQGQFYAQFQSNYAFKFKTKLNNVILMVAFILILLFFFVSLQINNTVERGSTTNVTEWCWSPLPNWWKFTTCYAWISITINTFSAYSTLFAIFTVKVSKKKNTHKTRKK